MSEQVGVIFDMDGVIMDNNLYHKKAWHAFCEIHKIHITEEEFHNHIFGRIAKDTIDYIFKKPHSKEEVNAYVDEKELFYRNIYKNEIKLTAGLYPFLEELKRKNVPIGLATSAPTENLEFVFRHLPIEDFFSSVLDASDIKKGKPDPEIYIRAIRDLDVDPHRCVIFEDSLSGIQSALGAGACVVGVATTHKPEEFKGVQFVIPDFGQMDYDKVMYIIHKHK
jgi:HAD superfamily hydrolase (TIGR01509 family)